MNILYIEDEPNDAALIAMYLKAGSHQLQIVESIEEAEQAITNPPGLVLVDVMLKSRFDGCRFVEQARKTGYEGPIIALTALSTPDDMAVCRRAGFTQILNKPYTMPELAAVLSRYTA